MAGDRGRGFVGLVGEALGGQRAVRSALAGAAKGAVEG